MSLYITDLTDDEPLPDYSVLKEAFMAAEAKAASNTITKTSEGLKVDIFKENIGIEREGISPRTRFIDPLQDFECTHPIVLNPHSSFLKHVRPTFESTFPYGSLCHTANTQTTTTQSNNTTSNNSCLNQDQSTEMTRQGTFFMELQGTSLSDNSNFTQQQVS